MNPSRPPALEPDGVFDGLQWGCIVRGALLDIGLTLVASIPLLFLLAGDASFSDDEEIARRATDEALASREGLVLGAVVGLSATVIAAYYGARRARTLHVRHGGWIAITSLLLGLPFLFMPGAQSSVPNPVWYDVFTMVAMLPAGVLGGAIAKLREGAV